VPPKISIIKNFESLYRDQGKLIKAEEMFQQAYNSWKKSIGASNYGPEKKKMLGSNHLSTLGAVNNLALVYQDQGKLKEAEGMRQEALTCYETTLGHSTAHNLV
jgi:tetratricopeptide (TPR) repeat protein